MFFLLKTVAFNQTKVEVVKIFISKYFVINFSNKTIMNGVYNLALDKCSFQSIPPQKAFV